MCARQTARTVPELIFYLEEWKKRKQKTKKQQKVDNQTKEKKKFKTFRGLKQLLFGIGVWGECNRPRKGKGETKY